MKAGFIGKSTFDSNLLSSETSSYSILDGGISLDLFDFSGDSFSNFAALNLLSSDKAGL